MTSLWQGFVDTIDTQISVDDAFWIRDFGALTGLPFVPFVIVLFLANPGSTVVNVALAATAIFEVWWIPFLLHRRAAKKRNYIEPARFSDDDGGY